MRNPFTTLRTLAARLVRRLGKRARKPKAAPKEPQRTQSLLFTEMLDSPTATHFAQRFLIPSAQTGTLQTNLSHSLTPSTGGRECVEIKFVKQSDHTKFFNFSLQQTTTTTNGEQTTSKPAIMISKAIRIPLPEDEWQRMNEEARSGETSHTRPGIPASSVTVDVHVPRSVIEHWKPVDGSPTGRHVLLPLADATFYRLQKLILHHQSLQRLKDTLNHLSGETNALRYVYHLNLQKPVQDSLLTREGQLKHDADPIDAFLHQERPTTNSTPTSPTPSNTRRQANDTHTSPNSSPPTSPTSPPEPQKSTPPTSTSCLGKKKTGKHSKPSQHASEHAASPPATTSQINTVEPKRTSP